MLKFLSAVLLTLYRPINREYIPLLTVQTRTKQVQNCILRSVVGLSVLVFNYTNLRFLLDFSQNSVLMDDHVNEIDITFYIRCCMWC
jgi:hypothetical protein